MHTVCSDSCFSSYVRFSTTSLYTAAPPFLLRSYLASPCREMGIPRVLSTTTPMPSLPLGSPPCSSKGLLITRDELLAFICGPSNNAWEKSSSC